MALVRAPGSRCRWPSCAPWWPPTWELVPVAVDLVPELPELVAAELVPVAVAWCLCLCRPGGRCL